MCVIENKQSANTLSYPEKKENTLFNTFDQPKLKVKNKKHDALFSIYLTKQLNKCATHICEN